MVSVAFIGASHNLVTAAHDATARVWDGERGRCLHVLAGHEGAAGWRCVYSLMFYSLL